MLFAMKGRPEIAHVGRLLSRATLAHVRRPTTSRARRLRPKLEEPLLTSDDLRSRPSLTSEDPQLPMNEGARSTLEKPSLTSDKLRPRPSLASEDPTLEKPSLTSDKLRPRPSLASEDPTLEKPSL
eukprot:Opistho-2@69353